VYITNTEDGTNSNKTATISRTLKSAKSASTCDPDAVKSFFFWRLTNGGYEVRVCDAIYQTIVVRASRSSHTGTSRSTSAIGTHVAHAAAIITRTGETIGRFAGLSQGLLVPKPVSLYGEGQRDRAGLHLHKEANATRPRRSQWGRRVNSGLFGRRGLRWQVLGPAPLSIGFSQSLQFPLGPFSPRLPQFGRLLGRSRSGD
jgi:hypothetical protein